MTLPMICNKCGNSWDENYCPICGQSINKSIASAPVETSQSKAQSQTNASSTPKNKRASLLSAKTTKTADLNKEFYRRAAKRDFIFGGIALLLGIFITAFTLIFYTIGGGFMIITWGAILYGIIRIARGIKISGKL